MQPSIDRNTDPRWSLQEREKEEQSLLEDFANDAMRFLGPLEQNYLAMRSPQNYFPVASVMQHYGAPTRLLDWTFSPWVAAYFAVIDDWDKDGAIWWFSCRSYQPAMQRQWNRLGWHTTGEKPDDPIAKAFCSDCPEFITQAQLGIPFERASAQQAVFTLAAPLGCYHDDVLARVFEEGQFGRIVIPAGIKNSVERMLYTMNIHAKSLHHARADYEGFKLHWRRGGRP
ncbi:MAG: FRG domain-containing protein [Planctomycetes bacterium]|nr:FRG domain-containing protein [Planctomycetota bacterium]